MWRRGRFNSPKTNKFNQTPVATGTVAAGTAGAAPSPAGKAALLGDMGKVPTPQEVAFAKAFHEPVMDKSRTPSPSPSAKRLTPYQKGQKRLKEKKAKEAAEKKAEAEAKAAAAAKVAASSPRPPSPGPGPSRPPPAHPLNLPPQYMQQGPQPRAPGPAGTQYRPQAPAARFPPPAGPRSPVQHNPAGQARYVNPQGGPVQSRSPPPPVAAGYQQHGSPKPQYSPPGRPQATGARGSQAAGRGGRRDKNVCRLS